MQKPVLEVEKEVHKPIVGWPGYYATYDGRIISVRRIANTGIGGNHRDRVLAIALNHGGYPRVTLWYGKRKQTISVHRLVASAWIPNPDNLPEVNHIDGNRTNNRADNLEWVSRSANQTHAYRNIKDNQLKPLNDTIKRLTEERDYWRQRCEAFV